jgi:hypothetical protein
MVGFPPGGGADAVARIVSEKLGRVLNQAVLVDNRPGAGTTIASDLVARAPADGYTLLLGSANLYGTDQILYKSARYDGVRSFTPIMRWSDSPMLLAVKKDFPEKTVAGLIEQAAGIGKLTYSSSGTGVVTHLAGASFAHAAGIDMLHVPFKGGSVDSGRGCGRCGYDFQDAAFGDADGRWRQAAHHGRDDGPALAAISRSAGHAGVRHRWGGLHALVRSVRAGQAARADHAKAVRGQPPGLERPGSQGCSKSRRHGSPLGIAPGVRGLGPGRWQEAKTIAERAMAGQ